MASPSPERQDNAMSKEEYGINGPVHHESTKDGAAATETVVDVLNNSTIERQLSHSPRPSTRSSSVSATSQTPPEKKKKVSLADIVHKRHNDARPSQLLTLLRRLYVRSLLISNFSSTPTQHGSISFFSSWELSQHAPPVPRFL